MKRLILFELIILFLATTFESDSPPGWFQQTIAIGNRQITDIHFLDSSNGWVVTNWGPAFDTAYVFKTSDGGNNWNFQYRFHGSFNALHMTDYNTGYIVGSTGTGKVWKTVNAGINWNIISSFSANPIADLYFINNETGWICSDDPSAGGVFKTTNGGVNWQPQLGASSFPKKLFFLNQDTGWVASSEANGKLYRTTNGGQLWNLQYDFGGQINDVCFRNGNLGWVSGGSNYKTTNGGLNWIQGNDGGIKLFFVNDSIGWAGNNLITIIKTSNAGNNWFRQTTNVSNPSVTAYDSLTAWAGGSALVKTTDGGGPPVGIQQISSEIPSDYKLYQNYPNPFNPVTNIKFSVKRQTSNVKLVIYNIQGKQVTELVNQSHNTGTYEADWNASGYPSGVYFYSLVIEGIPVETLKMLMIK